jgi:amidase
MFSTAISRRQAVQALSAAGIAALSACRTAPPAMPPSGRVTSWSVRTIRDAIRRRELSCEQVVRLHLERIASTHSQLNAVVTLRPDAALDEARSADAALGRNEAGGALHGVPMTIKDSFDTAGVLSTGGTLGRATFVPEIDAAVVSRLRAAGAILLGKTNTPEFTLGLETENFIFGRTNNPYEVTRSPGGSSGGAAAIIAAEGSPFDIGSDTGGSVRLPAHFCGIAGLKPTAGRVPRTGHIIPFGMGAVDALTQLGPLGRYVDDLELLLPIVMGTDWNDPAIVDMPLGPSSAIQLRGLRIAFFASNTLVRASPAIEDTVRATARVLEAAGAHVEERVPPDIASTLDVVFAALAGDGGAWVARLVKRAGTARLSPNVANIISAPKMDGAELTAAFERLDQYRSHLLQFMRGFDALICPVESHSAAAHGEHNRRQPAETYVFPFNMTGQPAAVVRAGTSADGLPIGIQIATRHWREDIAFAIARHVESEMGGWQPTTL